VDKLLQDVPKLKSILTDHLVSGKVMAADVMETRRQDGHDVQRAAATVCAPPDRHDCLKLAQWMLSTGVKQKEAPMQASGSALLVQQAIQLSVAPVFLLTGIAALLGVMANRLARIIDRARAVGREWVALDAVSVAAARLEVASLERRRHLASWSINCCTGAALLVCTVIVTLFIEEFLGADLTWLAGAQFITTMLALIAGLSCFLVEVYIATHASRIDAQVFESRRAAADRAALLPPLP